MVFFIIHFIEDEMENEGGEEEENSMTLATFSQSFITSTTLIYTLIILIALSLIPLINLINLTVSSHPLFTHSHHSH